MPLNFRRPSSALLKVDGAALAHLLSFRQSKPWAQEAGGVLIGRHIAGTEDLVIDMATGPLPGDVRTRRSFFRAQQRHQGVLDAEWQASGGRRVYIGEWHTHPEAIPGPSSIDLADWSRRLKADDVEADAAFFFIVGTIAIGAWEGSRQTGQITGLFMDSQSAR